MRNKAMWNAETAARLDEWYASDAGAFALRQEHLLFQHLVSSWPRRGYSLLEVGCGTGVFLEMLWEYGFDVTGLDSSPDMLSASRARLGNRADFRLGQADHLPYDDKSMDYVALLSVLNYTPDPRQALIEAVRVARRGVLVGFLNRWSFYGLSDGMPWHRRERRRGGWISVSRIRRVAREICPHCRFRSRSALLGPPGTWKNTRFWGRVNRLELPVPLGAYVGMCIDVQACVPLTPMPLSLRVSAKKSSVYGTVTSCGSRRSSG